MKLFLITNSIACFCTEIRAHPQDSVNVEILRNTVSEELMELRDSIINHYKNMMNVLKQFEPHNGQNFNQSGKS